MQFLGRRAVSFMSFFWCCKKTFVNPLTVDRDPCLPAPVIACDTSQSSGAVTSHPSVLRVLARCCNTQVRTSIVQRVSAYDVIRPALIPSLQTEYFSVHMNDVRLMRGHPLSIKTFSERGPACIPFPLIQPVIFRSIDQSNLPLREWNCEIGLVRGLGFLLKQVHVVPLPRHYNSAPIINHA